MAGFLPTGKVNSSLVAARFGDGAFLAPCLGTLSIKGDKTLGIPGDFGADITLLGAGVAASTDSLISLDFAHFSVCAFSAFARTDIIGPASRIATVSRQVLPIW